MKKTVIAACLSVSLVTTPVLATVFDEIRFQNEIVGVELTGLLGIHLIFEEDGSLSGGMGGDVAIEGTWSFDGDTLCYTMFPNGMQMIEHCGVPERTNTHFVVPGEDGLNLRLPSSR